MLTAMAEIRRFSGLREVARMDQTTPTMTQLLQIHHSHYEIIIIIIIVILLTQDATILYISPCSYVNFCQQLCCYTETSRTSAPSQS